MTHQQELEVNARATAFIDTIISINKEHHMGGDVTEEEYRSAVSSSASAVRPLLDRSQSSSPTS